MGHIRRRWRKEHPGKLSPLPAFMAVTTMGLWLIATLGVAAEVLLQLIPWSFGWIERIHVGLSRALFWYFGHPLVYFWLLGLYRVVRARTAFTMYGDHETALGWLSYQQAMAMGGALLFIGVLLMLWIVIRLAFFAPRAEGGVDYPVVEVAEGAEPTPAILERWPLWVTVAFALILVAYTGPIAHMIQHAPPGSPPFQPY